MVCASVCVVCVGVPASVSVCQGAERPLSLCAPLPFLFAPLRLPCAAAALASWEVSAVLWVVASGTVANASYGTGACGASGAWGTAARASLGTGARTGAHHHH